MADGKVTLKTEVDPSGAQRDIKALGPILKKVGGLVAAAFSVKAIVDFSKNAVAMASDLQEVQNVVDTAFGSMAYKMEEFAEKSIEMYGISKLTAKQTGSTYMAMARGMGLPLEKASDMAIALTGLSADMASFYNVEQDVAKTALASVFTGETETLKKYGIVMTQTNLQNFAYTQGINKSIQAMSQAEQTQLRYLYVMEQTKLAQGDFAKTSDSWANQTRILSERWKEFSGIIGTGLLQVLTPVVQVLNVLLSKLIAVTTVFMKFLGVSTQVSSSGGGAVSEVAESMEDVTEETKKAQKAAKGYLGTFDELNNVNSTSGSGSAGGGGDFNIDFSKTDDGAIEKMEEQLSGLQKILEKISKFIDTKFGAALRGVWTEFMTGTSELRGVLGNMFSDMSTLEGPLRQFLLTDVVGYINSCLQLIQAEVSVGFSVINTILQDSWNTIIFPIIQGLITNILPIVAEFFTYLNELVATNIYAIGDIFGVVWETTILPLLELIKNIVLDVFTSCKNSWDTYGKPIFDALTEAVLWLTQIFNDLWTACIAPILQSSMDYLQELWDNFVKPIVDDIIAIIGELILAVGALWNNWLAPLVDFVCNTFGPLIAGAFEVLLDIVKPIINTLGTLIKSITTTLKGVMQFITGVFTGDWKKAWDGIKNIFKGVWDALVGIIKVPINLIIGLINGLIHGIQAGLNFIVDAVNRLSFTVPDWVPGIGGSHFGFNLPRVNFGTIPYLATGAVLPPNNPFMAVVGDQKHGTNIEAPLDTIKQALSEVMDGRGSGEGDIIVQIDGREVFRAIRNQDKEYRNMNGRSAFSY